MYLLRFANARAYFMGKVALRRLDDTNNDAKYAEGGAKESQQSIF